MLLGFQLSRQLAPKSMHFKLFGQAARTSRDSANGSATKARARPAHEPSAPPDLAALPSQSTAPASSALPFCAQDAHTPSPCHLSSTPTARCSWPNLVGHARVRFRHPQGSPRPLRPTNRRLLAADPRAARERVWGQHLAHFSIYGRRDRAFSFTLPGLVVGSWGQWTWPQPAAVGSVFLFACVSVHLHRFLGTVW